MFSIALTATQIALAIAAAVAIATSMAAFVQFTARRPAGYLHNAAYAILASTAMAILLSGRVLNNEFFFSYDTGGQSMAVGWVMRLTSIFLLLAASERIISNLSRTASPLGPSPTLMLGYLLFWFGTVVSPAIWGAYPYFSHDYAYPLVIGVGALVLSSEEREQALLVTRNGLLLFLLSGFLVLPFKPDMVMEFSYAQGFIPGLPRFAGLSAHAVSLGMLAQLALLLLWAYPCQRRWLNRLSWCLGLLTLFLAQSKTAWTSFSLCAVILFIGVHGSAFRRRVGDFSRPHFGVALAGLALFLCLTFAGALLFSNIGTRIDHFLNSQEGAQLTSLTGRDLIWKVAFAEWSRNPLFGYGPLFLDSAYRVSIGMPNATHAHNQFVDVLARAGLVGAIALVIYCLILMAMAIRNTVNTRGLSLALFLALALRGVSEVPLTLFGYGPEFISHLVLLLLLLPAYRKYPVGQATSGQLDSPHTNHPTLIAAR